MVVSKVAEKIPGWVERLLIPTLESKVRSIVSEEVGHLEKVLDARFDGVQSEIRRVDEKIGLLEKHIPKCRKSRKSRRGSARSKAKSPLDRAFLTKSSFQDQTDSAAQ